MTPPTPPQKKKKKGRAQNDTIWQLISYAICPCCIPFSADLKWLQNMIPEESRKKLPIHYPIIFL